MADEINDIVEIFISRETAQVNTAQFDIPLLLVEVPDVDDPANPGTDIPGDVTLRVRTYRNATAVADDFGVGSVAHTMALKLLGGDIRPSEFRIGVKNSAETYPEAVNACIAYDADWYALAIESKMSGDIEAVAELIQGYRRMFFASTADIDVLDPVPVGSVGTDIGSILKDAGYDRTVLVYSEQAASDSPEVAWMGTQLVEIPGSNTWAFKRGAGVTVSKLTASNITTLKAKNVNYYISVAGVNMFLNGQTSQGEWIDTIIGIDWLQARLQEQIFYRMATKKKIPYTSRGFAIIEAEMRSVLSQGVANGLIADTPAYTVTVPDPLAIPETLRAQRVAETFYFTARLASAVHRLVIRGTVTY